MGTKQTLIPIGENRWQVKVSLPFPLRWVNSYVFRGRDGFTVLDPGLHTPESEETWESAMAEIGFRPEDVERIVLTHHHPDHYGMTGWFQERSSAPVFLSAAGCRQVQLLWAPDQPMTRLTVELFIRHGLEPALLEPMTKHLEGFVRHVSPQPLLTPLREGETVRLGDKPYEAIHTPGHALGHLCFYDASAHEIFCGDHVLPQISPNVSFLPAGLDNNPLGAYLGSLLEISRLPVAMAYPGHRDPFAKFGSRCTELIAHHEQRLSLMMGHLRDPFTAYQLCRIVFGERLTVHQLRFAMAETLAHLAVLAETGRAEMLEQGELVTFVRK